MPFRDPSDIKEACEHFSMSPEFRMLGQRQLGFMTAMEHLLSQNEKFCIIETGSLRSENTAEAWQGDGRSTAVWAFYMDEYETVVDYLCTKVYSIDLDKHAVDRAASQHDRVEPVLGNSLKVLPECDVWRCKLLYLDSFDWSPAQNQNSAWHHMAELALVYAALPAGCMIMIDDAHGEYQGKHWIVAEFFKTIGVEPILKGYQWAWVKPLRSHL